MVTLEQLKQMTPEQRRQLSPEDTARLLAEARAIKERDTPIEQLDKRIADRTAEFSVENVRNQGILNGLKQIREGREPATYLKLLKRLEDKGIFNNPVVNENHPDIGFFERLGTKNLSRDPESAIEVYQRNNPDNEFKVDDETGKVITRRDGEREWRFVDRPRVGDWYNPIDQAKNLLADPQDATDIVGDVGKGVVDTAGTALGAIGGFFTGGPAGVLPGAAAGGGLASGTSETLRQGVAHLTGNDKGFDGKKILGETAFGVGAPLLLGAGVSGKQAIKHVGEEAAEQLLKSQSGLAKKGYDFYTESVNPFITSAITGVDRGTVDFARKNLDFIKKQKEIARAAGDAPGGNLVAPIYDEIQDAFKTQAGRIDEEAAAAVANNPIGIDFKKQNIEQPYDDLLEKYQKKEDRLLGQKIKKYTSESKKNKLLDKTKEQLEKVSKGKQTKKSAEKIAQLEDRIAGLNTRIANEAETKARAAIKKSNVSIQNKKIKDQIEQYRNPFEGELDFTDIRDFKKGNTPLSNIHRSPDYDPNNVVAQELQTATKQVNSRVKEAISEQAGGEEINEALSKWQEHFNTGDYIRQYLGGSERNLDQLESTLSNFHSRARAARSKVLNDTGKNIGVNLKGLSEELKAAKIYAEPAWVPLSRAQSTSTTRSLLVPGRKQGLVSDGMAKLQFQLIDALSKGGQKVNPSVSDLLRGIGSGSALDVQTLPAVSRELIKQNPWLLDLGLGLEEQINSQ